MGKEHAELIPQKEKGFAMVDTMSKVQFRALTDEQCEAIVDAAYRILETTGVKVTHEGVRDMLAEKGCAVKGEIVQIPRELMKWSLEVAPSEFDLYTRDGEPAMHLACDGPSYFGTVISSSEMPDLDTHELRATTREDCENFVTLADGLENIDWMCAGVAVTDVPQSVQDIAEVQVMLPRTNKPIMYWAMNTENLEAEFEMFDVVAGSREAFAEKPFAINLICPQDPLVQPGHSLDQIIFMAENNAPFVYISGIGFGLGSPMSVASGMALGVANTLVGNLVAQLTREGAPYLAGKFMDNIDFATGNVMHGRPELLIANMATADVFRYLKMPYLANFCSTDSCDFDLLAAGDTSLQTYCAEICGANMIFALGAMGSGVLVSFEKLVYNNEMIEYARRMKGFEVSEEAFFFDEIDDEGPGGNFLAADSTIENMREFYIPRDLKPRKKGQKELLLDELSARAKEIIAAGVKNPLDGEKTAQIDAIMDRVLAAHQE